MLDEVITGYVQGETGEGYPEEWDLDKLWRAFRQLFPVTLTIDELVEEAGGDKAGLTTDFIVEAVIADAQAAYDRREEEFGPEVTRELERRVVLSVLDRKWREHLYEMDYLREGIGLRGYGQRDPLIEYQREGYDMFNAMMEGIKEESVGHLFNLEVQIQENPIVEEGAPGAAPAGALPAGAPGGAVNGGTVNGGAVNGGGAPGVPGGAQAGAPGGVVPGVPAPANPAAPAGEGRPGVPAQAGPGSRSGRGGAHRGSSARGGGQAAQAKRDGRVSSGTHAKRAGTGGTAAAQSGDGGQNTPVPAGLAPRQPQRLQYSAPSVDGGNHVEHSEGPAVADEFARVGRNDPCPCGSGRKFKRCHGDPRNRTDV